jgi:hypothetical protein
MCPDPVLVVDRVFLLGVVEDAHPCFWPLDVVIERILWEVKGKRKYPSKSTCQSQ